MQSKFLEFKNNVRKLLHTIFSILIKPNGFNKWDAREYKEERIEDEKETDASTHFLRIQKNQLLDWMQRLQRYTNTLPVFRFNSSRCDINFFYSYLIPYLINEKEIEPIVMKKAHVLVSFKIGDVQFLNMIQFLGRATTFTLL